MIIWNFNTPVSFIASVIWNTSEKLGIGLGSFSPYIFGLVIQSKSNKKTKEKMKDEK